MACLRLLLDGLGWTRADGGEVRLAYEQWASDSPTLRSHRKERLNVWSMRSVRWAMKAWPFLIVSSGSN